MLLETPFHSITAEHGLIAVNSMTSEIRLIEAGRPNLHGTPVSCTASICWLCCNPTASYTRLYFFPEATESSFRRLPALRRPRRGLAERMALCPQAGCFWVHALEMSGDRDSLRCPPGLNWLSCWGFAGRSSDPLELIIEGGGFGMSETWLSPAPEEVRTNDCEWLHFMAVRLHHAHWGVLCRFFCLTAANCSW